MKVHTRSDGKRYVDQDELVESVVKNMGEPTIDECVKWVRTVANYSPVTPVQDMICAILEKHEAVRTKLMLLETAANFQEHKAVRAFVGRVEKRFMGTPIGYGLHKAMQIELAAMEAEVKE